MLYCSVLYCTALQQQHNGEIDSPHIANERGIGAVTQLQTRFYVTVNRRRQDAKSETDIECDTLQCCEIG